MTCGQGNDEPLAFVFVVVFLKMGLLTPTRFVRLPPYQYAIKHLFTFFVCTLSNPLSTRRPRIVPAKRECGLVVRKECV
jgi:hypothetical protein